MVDLVLQSSPTVISEKLEDGLINIVIRRGYSAYDGLKWRTKRYEREYLTRLCRLMIDNGAPAHHLEEAMTRAATRLNVDLTVQLTAESILLSFCDDIAPTLPLILGDWETVNLANLKDIFCVDDAVINSKTTLKEANETLKQISERKNLYGAPFTVLLYGLTCACIAPPALSARLVDLPVVFCSGFCLGLVRTYLTPRSYHRDILDFLLVGVTSFVSRFLSSITQGQICFSALAQAPLVIIIPGYTVASGCLQLMSTNKCAGSSRIIYAVVQAIILGFSVTIGTSIYGSFDSNATPRAFCSNALPDRISFIFVLPLVLCVNLLSQARWQQIPIMAFISISGFLVTNLLKHKVVTEVANLCGAFTLGSLVNVYSALVRRSAAEVLLAGLFIQLPSGVAAHGSMVGGIPSGDKILQPSNNYTTQDFAAATSLDSIIDFRVAYTMLRVAIMVALGLRAIATPNERPKPATSPTFVAAAAMPLFVVELKTVEGGAAFTDSVAEFAKDMLVLRGGGADDVCAVHPYLTIFSKWMAPVI